MFSLVRSCLVRLCLVASLTVAVAPAVARAAPTDSARTPHVELSVLSEQARLAAGTTAWVGFNFKIKKHWHIYWRNPGDSGYPPSVLWDLPAGVSAGEIQWPSPERLPFGPLVNFGYSDQVMLALPLTVAADFRGDQLPLKARVKWLVCEKVCIPEEAELALTLPVAVNASANPAVSPWFAQTRSRWPAAAAPAGWTLEANTREGGGVRLKLAGATATSLVFFPFEEGYMNAAGAQNAWRHGDRLILDLQRADVPIGPWQTLTGVLVAGVPGGKPVDAGGTAAFAVELPVGPPLPDEPIAPVSSPAPVLGLLAALALALAGGALLNLMPCVFPVLSIKLLALMKDEASLAQGRSHALFYSLGVVISFVLLAAVLLALRAAGASLGWGFQLQEPAVIGALALLFFALGLSLSGALPIATLAQDVPGAWRLRHPHIDALASGGLAVLVASPCTAPFMGAALGAALAMSAAETLLVFAVLGLGMALPFALLVRYPALRRWLPRPGPWMERLKELLALPLYATVVWLGWVLAEQTGAAAVLTLGAALVAMALMAWCLRLRHDRWRVAGATLALLAAITIVLWPATQAAAPAADANARWQPWSPESFAAAQASGQAVFVDFTAAWCVTCQVNKRLVLQRDDVLAEFAARKVTLLRADWTRHDPAITAELTRLGRSGVPVYALYQPSQPAHLLPEILTPALVAEALRKLPQIAH